MANEQLSSPGQMADIVTSIITGITMNVEKLDRKTVMKR